MPKGLIRETATNYTEINRVFLSHGHRHMLDPQMLNIPYDQSITIYDKTKVKFLGENLQTIGLELYLVKWDIIFAQRIF